MSKYSTHSAKTEKHKAPERRRANPDPLTYQSKSLSGNCYCTQCGAISYQKHWYLDASLEKKLRRSGQVKPVMCPGCKRVEEQLFEGEVVLANSRFATLAGEIVALIKHVEGRLWHQNPLAKIWASEDTSGLICIRTTTKALAETIGKELHKTFRGKLEVRRSPEYLRVYWQD